MKLLLKETIRANGVRYLPKSIVDTAEIGITDADADVLVRRGTATVVVDEVPSETDEQRQAREAAEAAANAEREAAAAAEAEAAAKAQAEAEAKAAAEAAAAKPAKAKAK